MSKFKVGQEVVLFNSISCRFEKDTVYGVLFVPVPVEGVQQSGDKSVAEKLAAGQMVVAEQYQLVGHQGILDAGILFASEAECREWYLKLLGE